MRGAAARIGWLLLTACLGACTSTLPAPAASTGAAVTHVNTEEKAMLLGMRTVIYPVGDLAAARDWYAQVVGHAPYFDQPFYVGFNVGGFELGLVPDGTPATTGPAPHWGVPDVTAALARLLALGATALEPVTEVGDSIKVAAVVDPFGNRLALIENPHFDPRAVR